MICTRYIKRPDSVGIHSLKEQLKKITGENRGVKDTQFHVSLLIRTLSFCFPTFKNLQTTELSRPPPKKKIKQNKKENKKKK